MIFQKELEKWELTTPVPEEKMGAVITSMLPNDSKLKKDLKEKFFENVMISDLDFYLSTLEEIETGQGSWKDEEYWMTQMVLFRTYTSKYILLKV